VLFLVERRRDKLIARVAIGDAIKKTDAILNKIESAGNK
jgi:predicted DNA-binding protein YlxM (UPF0122 family)